MSRQRPPRDDDDALLTLPERDVLDAWEVPMPTPDLTDRILDHVDEAADALPSLPGPGVHAMPRQRGGYGWALVGVGMVAAAALVLGLVRLTMDGPAPQGPVSVVAPPSAPPSVDAVLLVRTTPVDATVLVDGRPVSGPSPFSVVGLAPGAHRLRVEREGFLPVERIIEGGSERELPIELPRRDVVLSLEVDPPEAEVRLWVDDVPESIGHDGDRYALRRDAEARYEVEAVAPGYRPRRVPLPLTHEPDQTVRLMLVRDETAPAPPVLRERVDRERPGSPDLKDPFQRDPDEAGEASDSEDDEPGRLRIGTASGDPPAQVFVDGKRVGTTPVMNVEVKPGAHRISFRFPDGRSETRRVLVGPGQTMTVKNR